MSGISTIQHHGRRAVAQRPGHPPYPRTGTRLRHYGQRLLYRNQRLCHIPLGGIHRSLRRAVRVPAGDGAGARLGPHARNERRPFPRSGGTCRHPRGALPVSLLRSPGTGQACFPFREGRCTEGFPNPIHEIYLTEENYVYGDLYLNAEGMILSNGDLSYVRQRQHALCPCGKLMQYLRMT